MALKTSQPGIDHRLLMADTKVPIREDPLSGGHCRVDDIEEAIDRIIEQVHCRLLEAATRGHLTHLTFVGDTIVRVMNVKQSDNREGSDHEGGGQA